MRHRLMSAGAGEDIERIEAPWGGHVEVTDLDRETWPEDIQDMAESIGIPRTIALCGRFGGCQIYFPKPAGLLRSARDAAIRRLFNGANIKELSRKFAISGRQIYDIIGTAGRDPGSLPLRYKEDKEN